MTLMLTLTLNAVKIGLSSVQSKQTDNFLKYKLLFAITTDAIESLYSIFLCWLNCIYHENLCLNWELTMLYDTMYYRATETACLTPGVTKQGYKSQKCEISINHNLASLTKQWIARQIIGNLTRTKHGSHATSWDQCLLVCLTISCHVTPWWPRYGQVTCAPSPLSLYWSSPFTNPWPAHHWVIRRGSETTSSYVESSNPRLSESMNGHLTISNHPEPGHSWVMLGFLQSSVTAESALKQCWNNVTTYMWTCGHSTFWHNGPWY